MHNNKTNNSHSALNGAGGDLTIRASDTAYCGRETRVKLEHGVVKAKNLVGGEVFKK